MAKYELEIKEASSSISELVFIKIPDHAQIQSWYNGIFKYYSKDGGYEEVEIPKSEKGYSLLGYSHNLTQETIKQHFTSENEFYSLLSYHEIFYNYSQWTGKWVVLVKKQN